MRNLGWMLHTVTQDKGALLERLGPRRTNPLIRTARGALILAFAFGAIGATEAVAASTHASGAHPRISLSSQQTAPGNDIGNHWMY
jgi:hypothetical protein